MATNDIFAKFLDASDAESLEKINYRDILVDDSLKEVLKNDTCVLNTKKTLVFNELGVTKNKQNLFLSIKSPLYNENQVVGLCGISFILDKQNVVDFLDIVKEATNILQEDWSHKIQSLPPTPKYCHELTPREVQCLSFYMRGYSSRNIADSLGLSHRTTEFYLDNIKSKLGVNKRSELLPLAFELYPELVHLKTFIP